MKSKCMNNAHESWWQMTRMCGVSGNVARDKKGFARAWVRAIATNTHPLKFRRVLGTCSVTLASDMIHDGCTLTRETPIDISAHGPDDLTYLHERVRTEADAKARDRCRCVVLAVEGATVPEDC